MSDAARRPPWELRRIPWATVGTALLLVVVHVWQVSDSEELSGAALVRQGARSLPHQLELGEWWRLLSAPLLHAGTFHLVANLAYLLYVGWLAEAALGASGLLLLWTACALGSMAASSVFTPLPAVGASGVAFGLLGALVALGWRFPERVPPRVRRAFGWPVLGFVAWFLWDGWRRPLVDNACHLGGLVTGTALGSLLRPRDAGASAAARLGAAGLLIAGAGLGMPLAWRLGLLPGPSLGPPERVDACECRLALPRGWERLDLPGSGTSVRSPTGAARLFLRTRRLEPGPGGASKLSAAWRSEMERGPSSRPCRDVPAAQLGLPPSWLAVDCERLDSSGRLLRVLRVGLPRGATPAVELEFLHPDGQFADYERLRARMLATLSADAAAPPLLPVTPPAPDPDPALGPAP